MDSIVCGFAKHHNINTLVTEDLNNVVINFAKLSIEISCCSLLAPAIINYSIYELSIPSKQLPFSMKIKYCGQKHLISHQTLVFNQTINNMICINNDIRNLLKTDNKKFYQKLDNILHCSYSVRQEILSINSEKKERN